MSDLGNLLLEWRTRAERALDTRLPPATGALARLHTAMRYTILNGGKRLRACLVYAAGNAVGSALDALDDPACAVEFIHGYSLIHDDLPSMDNDDLRRGKPSCHKAFDEATALLAGDALQTLAFETLATNKTPTRLTMISVLARAIGSHGMVGGQMLDLASVGEKLSIEELEACYTRKTGALIEASVMLGALAHPTTEPNQLARLEQYGRAIGLAFQIIDDVLDVESSPSILGKTTGSDAARAKPNYAILLGVDQARARAQELITHALASLEPLGDNGRNLARLAHYVAQRTQ